MDQEKVYYLNEVILPEKGKQVHKTGKKYTSTR